MSSRCYESDTLTKQKLEQIPDRTKNINLVLVLYSNGVNIKFQDSFVKPGYFFDIERVFLGHIYITRHKVLSQIRDAIVQSILTNSSSSAFT